MPVRKHPTDAGADLIAAEDVEILPAEWQLVSAGIQVAIPVGFAGLVHSRSGLAANHGVSVLNAPGVIDSDYRGTVKVNLHNAGMFPVEVKKGDRIAQLLIQRIERPTLTPVAALDNTERGTGGHGSTGR
jgi:dUTP pyrophosphatase